MMFGEDKKLAPSTIFENRQPYIAQQAANQERIQYAQQTDGQNMDYFNQMDREQTFQN
jgi:hypothetical protein